MAAVAVALRLRLVAVVAVVAAACKFEVGLDEEKPARDYTLLERGANRYAYSWRKNYWDAVGSLLTKGYSVDSAIDRVYEAYGKNYSVTAILDAIIVDKHMNISRI